MKREELVRYDGEWYDANIVDCLLDEKDAKIAGFENALHWDNSEALINAVEKTKSLEEELAKARDEIKSLKEELFDKTKTQVFSVVDQRIDELKAEIESLKSTHDTEMMDAGMRERRLRRALWLARGYIMTLLKRDFQRLAYQCNNDDYKNNLLRRRNRYYDLYEKCLKKVEEYQ